MRKPDALTVTLVFFGAFLATLLSLRYPWYDEGIVGNVCGPNGNQVCVGPILRAGFPFAYTIDNPGISVVSRLEDVFLIDKFVFWAFLLDILFYAVCFYGIWALLMWLFKP
jgi:hypothetical protein